MVWEFAFPRKSSPLWHCMTADKMATGTKGERASSCTVGRGTEIQGSCRSQSQKNTGDASQDRDKGPALQG